MLRRLTRFLDVLVLAAVVLGAAGFYLTYRPRGVGEWTVAAVHFVATQRPAAAFFVLAAVALSLLARRGRPAAPVFRRRGVRAVDARPSTARSPAAARRELRRRLEGLLRGRGDVVTFVDELLAGAVTLQASDVHLQPREGATLVQLRIEGGLEDVADVPASHHASLVRRLKVLAELVPYKTDKPQDGRFALETPGGPVDVRLSTVPTQHGEKAVARLVRPAAGLLGLQDLGLGDETEAAFADLLSEPQGLVVLTGPTGSGKTTTLYSALAHLHRARGSSVQIATIEDPVEIDLPFLSQTQVDRSQDLDFAAGLRALLRQDPNVLMVGEVRDAETAGIAVEAGLTGHLVLTTLHAESAAGVFARLIDMGVEPFLVSSATLATASQRLLKRLCPHCRRPARPGRDARRRLEGLGFDPAETELYEAVGCRDCAHTGTRGRTAVFELLRLTPELRRLVATGVPTQEIAEAARSAGMRALAEAAVQAAAEGRVSLDEALKVAP